MSKHTPAPWFHDRPLSPGNCHFVYRRIGPQPNAVQPIAWVETGHDDARVIAAAPDMRAALSAIVDRADEARNPTFGDIVMARDALNKAGEDE